MTPGSILLSLALFLAVLAYLLRPFFTPAAKESRSQRFDLLAEKDALLAQIQTLDFEFETGKLPEAAYQQQRQELIERAALVLQRFETAVSSPDNTLDAKIEAAVAKLRGIESEATHPCPECASPVRKSDKFCAHCGHKLDRVA